MTDILVTGATGFLGRHVVPRLRERGDAVATASSENGDVAELATWSRLPAASVVLHLAGKSFVPASWSDPGGFVRCNLLGTMGALDYCARHGARLVFISSYLYGRPESLPIPESARLLANNPYALSKKLAEEACRFYAASLGVDITILRPFNVYGTGQSESFLIPSIIRQAAAGEAIRVKDLEPRRDYVYIEDVVRAIISAVDRRGGLDIFNIGSGTSHSVEELVRVVQALMGTSLPVVSAGDRRKDEVIDTVADITHATRSLGWSPAWSLTDGVRQLVAESAPGGRARG